MIAITAVPAKVYDFLFQFKHHFRCAQARHFLLFCWLLVMLILNCGKGRLKQLCQAMPERLKYWALMRLLRSGQWDAQSLLDDVVAQTWPSLPPPADGVLYLIGDATLKGKRGEKYPLCRKARINEYAGYCFGFEMVLLVASWGKSRLPVAIRCVDPDRKGHASICFRQMLRRFQPPAWAKKVVVLGDAGFAAKKTFQVINRKKYSYVFAVSRTRKFADGKHLRDLVNHLPEKNYRRVASYKPDGRRQDYWIYSRRAELKDLGEVTMVLSKRRRNAGPKKTKTIVTNLLEAKVGEILSQYARRWGVELTIKESKGGLHLGQMQVTKRAERVERAVALPVLAYLLLVRLYGREEADEKRFSLLKLKQRFAADVFQEQLSRNEQKWRKKLDKYRLAA
ncbi:MAG TPA: transposase [Blastocatellia bacterium]|nr:transposase [Blastocatellia bacterium]